ncbi:MAG: carbohydrate-binding domain-containing protein [Pseudomonadota bacterium]
MYCAGYISFGTVGAPVTTSSTPTNTSSAATVASSRPAIASSRPATSSRAFSSSSSATNGCQQCNWYGTRYPLCVTTQSGWGWENQRSCISRTTCSSQPSPYGIVASASCP